MGMVLFEFLLDLIFPPKCVFCGRLLKDGEHGLCAGCQAVLPWTAAGEDGARCAGVSQCESPLWYRDGVRDSIHRYKFEGRFGYAPVFGRLMAQCVRDRLSGRFDLITWVPLSGKRRRERGYDQAFLLARAMARELNAEAVPALRKVRNIAAQSSLNDDGRRGENVRGVYEAAGPDLVAGKRVLIVDDVVTTGSTLSECARTLRAAGAADVTAVTLARAR